MIRNSETVLPVALFQRRSMARASKSAGFASRGSASEWKDDHRRPHRGQRCRRQMRPPARRRFDVTRARARSQRGEGQISGSANLVRFGMSPAYQGRDRALMVRLTDIVAALMGAIR